MVARLRVSDLARMALAWAISSLALITADWLLPGMHANSPWWLVAAAAVTGVFGFFLRPVLVKVASAIGWLAVGAFAIAGQAVIMHIALLLLPGVDVTSFWTLVAATWIAAAIGTFLTWLATAGTDDAFTATLRSYGRRHLQVADPEIDGVVFVQLDGVPFPVAQWALQSGTMPTLRRWVDSGTHRLQEWTVQLPCTTPASQQGILHGTLAGIPAFRWYDRELGRVLVANKPADALVIEERASTGLGLAGRRRCVHLQPVLGRCGNQHADHEQGEARAGARGRRAKRSPGSCCDPTGSRAALHVRRPRPCVSVSRPVNNGGGPSYPECIGRGPSPSSGR